MNTVNNFTTHVRTNARWYIGGAVVLLLAGLLYMAGRLTSASTAAASSTVQIAGPSQTPGQIVIKLNSSITPTQQIIVSNPVTPTQQISPTALAIATLAPSPVPTVTPSAAVSDPVTDTTDSGAVRLAKGLEDGVFSIEDAIAIDIPDAVQHPHDLEKCGYQAVAIYRQGDDTNPNNSGVTLADGTELFDLAQIASHYADADKLWVVGDASRVSVDDWSKKGGVTFAFKLNKHQQLKLKDGAFFILEEKQLDGYLMLRYRHLACRNKTRLPVILDTLPAGSFWLTPDASILDKAVEANKPKVAATPTAP